ncbi:hypothetical protein [Engelhardtia mirabilis]|uniref:Uncharacterized protein n=1 Tax=Engelhardtia mirabilis TaxID=2528011 RepID=A0A518BNC9_9BACT|nr:hypothetical protein Pla133_35680 [Planctomycetes bacterium Pla133]QDV02796.1 hypothetical protein Pla86_35660 [Planctomycetes bacterium Pla86]
MSQKDTDAAKERKPGAPPTSPDAKRPSKAPLDLENLDLTVEQVDERISPRETNVFDK